MMKRFITLLLCAVALIGAAGCQKVGDDQPKLDDRLVGTKWQTSDFAYKLLFGGNPYEVFEFVSTTELECYTTNGGNVVQSHGTWTYSLDYPHIIINEVSSGEITENHFTFKDSRTMVRDGVDEYNPYAKYIKQ